MTARSIALGSAILAASLVLTASTRAAISVDVDRATFNANVAPGSYTETFTQAGGSRASSYSFAGGTPTFGYTVSAPNDVYRSGTFIGNGTANEALTFQPTTGNISAFGGEFFLNDYFDRFQAVAETVTATDNLGFTASITFTPTSPTVGSFLGFRSTGLITSVVISAPGANLYGNADNITVGQGLAPNSVPEPGSLTLCVLGGLIGLGAVRFRRR